MERGRAHSIKTSKVWNDFSVLFWGDILTFFWFGLLPLKMSVHSPARTHVVAQLHYPRLTLRKELRRLSIMCTICLSNNVSVNSCLTHNCQMVKSTSPLRVGAISRNKKHISIWVMRRHASGIRIAISLKFLSTWGESEWVSKDSCDIFWLHLAMLWVLLQKVFEAGVEV